MFRPEKFWAIFGPFLCIWFFYVPLFFNNYSIALHEFLYRCSWYYSECHYTTFLFKLCISLLVAILRYFWAHLACIPLFYIFSWSYYIIKFSHLHLKISHVSLCWELFGGIWGLFWVFFHVIRSSYFFFLWAKRYVETPASLGISPSVFLVQFEVYS